MNNYEFLNIQASSFRVWVYPLCSQTLVVSCLYWAVPQISTRVSEHCQVILLEWYIGFWCPGTLWYVTNHVKEVDTCFIYIYIHIYTYHIYNPLSYSWSHGMGRKYISTFPYRNLACRISVTLFYWLALFLAATNKWAFHWNRTEFPPNHPLSDRVQVQLVWRHHWIYSQ